jgi:diguanylate cyclase (GGDEF)-like protein/PAS domain S-box-containing protein
VGADDREVDPDLRDDATTALPDGIFRQIVEQTPVPFVVIRTDGTIVHAGHSITALLGWDPVAVAGRNIGEFVGPEDVDLALTALGEIGTVDQVAPGVPVVFPLRRADGGWQHVEVAALPLTDEDALVALRLRSWEADRHMADLTRAMLAGQPLDVELQALTRALTATMEGVGTTVHHGFDGTRFTGVVGSWDAAAGLPLDEAPWVAVVEGDGIRVVPATHPVVTDLGAVTGWVVPVVPHGGLLPAVLTVWRDRPESPFLGHRQAIDRAVDVVELAILRAAEHRRLVHLARHDPLTGVLNRSTFTALLDDCLAAGETGIAVGFCDLDDFKRVNDRYGHRIGDELLVETTARLRASLRSGDVLARIGGDEFTILWRNVPDAAAAAAVATRVVEAGRQAFRVPDGTVEVGISVGLALATPGRNALGLIASADAALYQSKRDGGGRATTWVGP